jgi:hypothetical protein
MYWKFMQDVPYKMAPLSSFVVVRRKHVPDVAQPEIESEEKELPEGLWERGEGEFVAECNGCGRTYEIYCAPDEFCQDMSYCGGSPSCIP